MDTSQPRFAPDSEAETLPAARASDAGPGRVIAGRYRLVDLLGHGGHGVVWEAQDLLSGAEVALKLLGSTAALEPARVRREISALRILRLPGVVRLLDEGIDRGQPFLVMERCEGEPFPGIPTPCTWSALVRAATSLLETLGRVHAAGILHRDLKPGNVLTTAAGQVTILDFGISFGSRLGSSMTAGSALLGTPAYLAPEQILGERIDERTDLFAVGVMLFEALTGEVPHAADRISHLIRSRATVPAPPIAERCPSLPHPVCVLVDRLLARDPAGRPQSAADALAVLEGQSTWLVVEIPARLTEMCRTTPVTQEALRSLFRGPDRLFHLQTDGARALWARTGGDPARIVDEVTAWVDGGTARWDSGQLVVDRDALDRLELDLLHPASAAARTDHPGRARALTESAKAMATGDATRLAHLLLAGDVDESASRSGAIAREARALARRVARAGRLGQAVAALEEGLVAVRAASALEPGGDRDAERIVLAAWVEIALVESTPRALDRVLYEIVRARTRDEDASAAPSSDREVDHALEHLEALVRAALARSAGGERALEEAEAVPPFSDTGLERRRLAVRVLAARRCSIEREEAVLADVARWAASSNDPDRTAALSGWMGRLRYRQGRFDEAARLHLRAAAEDGWMTGRTNEQLNAASALMEAFRPREAAEVAEQARQLAARCRHAYFEARAEWILRACAYRLGEPSTADVELCDLTAQIGVVDLEGLVALTEAAVAWRAGQPEAGPLAERAARIWSGSGWRHGVMIARSLAMAAAGRPGPDAFSLAEEATACSVPGIGIQALGLLAMAGHRVPATAEDLERLCATVPREHWGARMDVLSVDEARDAIKRRTPATAEEGRRRP